jgi:hypothetical protein
MLLRHKLPEGEIYGSENNQLPSLWQDNLKRSLIRKGKVEGQMPRMWGSTGIQRRFSENRRWKDTALLLPRMRPSVFRTVNDIPNTHSFFGFKTTRRFLLETEGN